MKTGYGQSLPRHLTHFPRIQEASLVAQTVKNLPAMWETRVQSLGQEDPLEMSSIPGPGRSPGKGNGYPVQYSCLENSMDRGAWQAIQSMGSQRVTQD